MKINTKTVWQLTDSGMHIIEQDSHQYVGPVAHAFGGDSETSTSTTTTQDIDTTTLGIQDIEGTALAAGGDIEFNQTITDSGAVQGAFDFASDVSGQFVDLAEQAIAVSAGSIKTVGEATRSDTQQGLVQIAKFAALAVAVIFVGTAIFRRA